MTSGLLSYGDSKTVQQTGAGLNQGIWQGLMDSGLCRSIFVVQGPDEPVGSIAHGNHTVAELKAKIDADLARTKGTATKVLVNLGVKEMAAGLPAEATWESDLGYIVDAIHAKYPGALVYIDDTWRQGFDAAADTEAGWVDVVQSTRPWLRDGLDERSWLKGADNGATMSYDGIHYSTIGVATKATLMRALVEN